MYKKKSIESDYDRDSCRHRRSEVAVIMSREESTNKHRIR